MIPAPIQRAATGAAKCRKAYIVTSHGREGQPGMGGPNGCEIPCNPRSPSSLAGLTGREGLPQCAAMAQDEPGVAEEGPLRPIANAYLRYRRVTFLLAHAEPRLGANGQWT